MGYTDPLNHEPTTSNSEPNGGYWEDIFYIAPDDFFLNNAGAYVRLAVATASAPFLVQAQAPFMAIRYDNAAAIAAAVITHIQLPGQYDPETDDLVALVNARYSGTGTAVAALTLNCTANYFQPGFVDATIAETADPVGTQIVAGEATVQALASTNRTMARRVAAGFQNPGTSAGFYTYAYDLSLGVPGRTTSGAADINRFKPLTMLSLTLAPSALVGANNFLDILGVTIRIRRSATLNNRVIRSYGPAGWSRPR